MNKKNLLILTLACAIPFIFLAVRGFWVGFDAYAYVSTTCVDTAYSDFISGWLFRWILTSFVPCNFYFMTLLQFMATLVIAVAWSFLGERVLGKERGWLLGLFLLGLSPLIVILSGKFEEALFGYALASIGFVSFYIAKHKTTWHKKAPLLALSFITFFFGVSFWEGSLLLVFACIFLFDFWFILAIPVMAYLAITQYTYFFRSFNPELFIAEEAPIIGLILVAHFFRYLKGNTNKLKLTAIFLTLIGAIKFKYMFLAVPFLVLAYLKHDKPIKVFFSEFNPMYLTFAALIIYGIFLAFSNPTIGQLELTGQAVHLAKDSNIQLLNDWDYGWWVTSKDYNTQYKASYPDPDYNNAQKPFIALTKKMIAGCELIGKSDGNMQLLICR